MNLPSTTFSRTDRVSSVSYPTNVEGLNEANASLPGCEAGMGFDRSPWRARLRCFSIRTSNRRVSTPIPRSAAMSCVRSSGNPNVS